MPLRWALRLLRGAVADVTAALFPGECRGCRRSLPPETAARAPAAARRASALWDGRLLRRLPGGLVLPSWFVCPECAIALAPRIESAPLSGGTPCVTAFEPSPVLFALVHAFKYESQLQLAPWLAHTLALVLRARIGRDSVIVPVPSHADRVRERGFDASALLAAHVARIAGVATATGIVTRRRPTAPQAQLPHAARAANVAGAFARSGRVPRRRIVVVDDVVTTGATAGAVVAALGSSAAGVTVLALCRARDLGVQDAPRV